MKRFHIYQIFYKPIYLRGTMKLTNSPFAVLDKNINALAYQKRKLIYEDCWRRETYFECKNSSFNRHKEKKEKQTKVKGGAVKEEEAEQGKEKV